MKYGKALRVLGQSLLIMAFLVGAALISIGFIKKIARQMVIDKAKNAAESAINNSEGDVTYNVPDSDFYAIDGELGEEDVSPDRLLDEIPITEKCQMALDIAFSLPGNSDYVFHHPNGNPVLKQSYMYYLRRRCKTLGIEISNNHAFRVAFNARLIEAGVDGNERCFVLGHSMQTNERHYSFSDRRKADDVMEKLKRLETP